MISRDRAFIGVHRDCSFLSSAFLGSKHGGSVSGVVRRLESAREHAHAPSEAGSHPPWRPQRRWPAVDGRIVERRGSVWIFHSV